MSQKAVEEGTSRLGIGTSLQNHPQNYDVRDEMKVLVSHRIFKVAT